jgi:ATP-dependent Clp protease ATP-binding subunit ClpC
MRRRHYETAISFGDGPYDGLGERAREAVESAREEAQRLGHERLSTDHILLGLLRCREGVAARTMRALGIDLKGVRARTEALVGYGHESARGQVAPLTPRAQKVFEVARLESLSLGHHPYVGTGHMLLGLIAEPEGVTERVLAEAGKDGGEVRELVLREFSVIVQAGND